MSKLRKVRYSGCAACLSACLFEFTLDVQWRSADNTTLGVSPIKTYADDTQGEWKWVNASVVAPNGASEAQIRISVNSLNRTIYVDNFYFGR